MGMDTIGNRFRWTCSGLKPINTSHRWYGVHFSNSGGGPELIGVSLSVDDRTRGCLKSSAIGE